MVPHRAPDPGDTSSPDPGDRRRPARRQRRRTARRLAAGAAQDVTIRRFAERDHNVVHWTEYDKGGHFFAMEQPELFVADVRAFFRKVR